MKEYLIVLLLNTYNVYSFIKDLTLQYNQDLCVIPFPRKEVISFHLWNDSNLKNLT